MMNSDFKQLKRYVMRLNTVVNELESLEDFVDVSYEDIKTDIGYCTVLLEQRRERLQRKGRTQSVFIVIVSIMWSRTICAYYTSSLVSTKSASMLNV